MAVAVDARFCPNCGARLDGEAGEPGSVSYTQPEPRLFGVLAPVPTFVLACVLLAGSLVSLAAQSWILGVMLLAFAAALFVLFYGAAERDRESGVARATLGTVARVTGWTRFAFESAGAWSGAGRRVLQLRRELRPLRAQRKEVQFALGDAAYRQDEAGAASLRARMREIDDAIGAKEREAAEALEGARSRVGDERLAVQPTQHIPPDQVDETADEPR
jgi:hypothetical protein